MNDRAFALGTGSRRDFITAHDNAVRLLPRIAKI